MEKLSGISVLAFCVFSIFTFYQKIHIKQFNGSSSVFYLALTISTLAASITGLSYLVYYGWSVVWWAPIIIFSVGSLSTIVGLFLERIVGSLSLSLIGFFVWPIATYVMFLYIPK